VRTEPRLIVGAWQLSQGHRGELPTPGEIFAAWGELADAGFTTFDCADIYTGVETLLGSFRRWYANRSGTEAAARLRVHTKYVPDRDRLETLDRAAVERIVDRSLARLGVEALDLVQFAWWDYGVGNVVEVGRWLDDLRRAGKIREVGATNFDVPHLRSLVDAGIRLTRHQVQYSALDHRPEPAMTGFCLRHGIELLCYGTLAGGLLTDRFLGVPTPPEPATRSQVKYRLIVDEYGGWPALQELLRVMRRIADGHRVSVASVAIAYALRRPAVGAAIVGATSSRHLKDMLTATELRLDRADDMRIRDLAAAAPGPRGPVFGLERAPGGRHAAIMRYNLNREDDQADVSGPGSAGGS
jgi:aryl-alcohol dehydrogenase-like predicted oxidoreductase